MRVSPETRFGFSENGVEQDRLLGGHAESCCAADDSKQNMGETGEKGKGKERVAGRERKEEAKRVLRLKVMKCLTTSVLDNKKKKGTAR